MDKMKRKNQIGFYIFSLIVVVVILSMYMFSISENYEPEYVYLDSGWTLSGAVNAENISLDGYVFEQVNRGDEIYMKCTLPEYSYVCSGLVLYTIHCALNVKLDGEEIYNYGFEKLETPNKLLGYGYFLIDIPNNMQGKELEIYLKVSEDNAFTDITTPLICDSSRFIKDLIIEKRIPLSINIFLLMMGAIVFVVSMIFGVKNNIFFKLACIGAFAIGISAWSICNYDLIFVFTYNPVVKAYLEFSSLYCCTIPLILYFWDEMQKKKSWISILYYTLFLAQVCFVVLVFILQFMLVKSFPQVLAYQHLLLLVLAIFMVITCVVDVMTKTYKHISLAFGTGVLLTVGIVDILRFDLQKYVVMFQGKHYTSLVCVGTLVFTICQLIDFYMGLQNDFIQLAKTETLEKLAYIDELTGLYNRRKGEEEMDDIDSSADSCGIFSFDLNNLKKVNDTNGHEKGDEMIKAFAEVLKEAFGDDALVIRTGGDEFISIYRNPEDTTKRYYTDRIKILLDRKSAELGYQLTVAIGYSHTNDARNEDVKATLRRADARMYKHKATMKEADDRQ